MQCKKKKKKDSEGSGNLLEISFSIKIKGLEKTWEEKVSFGLSDFSPYESCMRLGYISKPSNHLLLVFLFQFSQMAKHDSFFNSHLWEHLASFSLLRSVPKFEGAIWQCLLPGLSHRNFSETRR